MRIKVGMRVATAAVREISFFNRVTLAEYERALSTANRFREWTRSGQGNVRPQSKHL